jgi:hypothetical protein
VLHYQKRETTKATKKQQLTNAGRNNLRRKMHTDAGKITREEKKTLKKQQKHENTGEKMLKLTQF